MTCTKHCSHTGLLRLLKSLGEHGVDMNRQREVAVQYSRVFSVVSNPTYLRLEERLSPYHKQRLLRCVKVSHLRKTKLFGKLSETALL